jgi:prolyl 4-hydroxylase
MSTTLSIGWQTWLLHNLRRGCSHESLLDELIKANISPAIAQQELAHGVSLLERQTDPGLTISSQPFLKTCLPGSNLVDLGDIQARLLVRLARPDLAYYENLLSSEECDELIELMRHKLIPSEVVDHKTGGSMPFDGRTSSSGYIRPDETELITRIDARLARLMGVPVENGETIQVLNYQIGAEFTPHSDYFQTDTPGGLMKMEQGGQRTATLIMYLNDVVDGGGTNFPKLGLTILPRKGSGLYFAYTESASGAPSDALSIHAGLPVETGEKWIATKWVRQGVFFSQPSKPDDPAYAKEEKEVSADFSEIS